MKTGASLKNRQGGAVAVMVGISMVVLIGFLAMVIDLGRLYVAKAGLQNAADAAALAGVKELDGTSGGVTSARVEAIEVAGLNTFLASLGQESVILSSSNIQFGTSQSGPWDDGSSPAGKLFIKVDTASRNLTTWFAPIWNIFTTSTFGMAVAGPIIQNVAPLAVCALLPDESTTEYGFRRGVNYNIIEVNERYVGVGGFPSVPLFLNPVDVPPATCNPSNGSSNFLRPFVCQGISALGQVGNGSTVYVNTGADAAQNRSLNSRFNNYTGSQCDEATAPPDTNVKEYLFDPDPLLGNCPMNSGNVRCGHPRDWMDPTLGSNIPTQPSMSPISASGVVPDPNTFANYGVLWSYAKERNHTTGSDYGLADWPALYGGNAVPFIDDGYPISGSGVPYAQTSGKYFQAPTGGGAAFAAPNRRVVNMVVVDCEEASNASCPVGGMPGYEVETLGIASFFMTVPAGLPDRLDVEFGGMVPAAGIERRYRLFR